MSDGSNVVEAEATSTTEADTTSVSVKAAVPAKPQVVAPKAEAKPAAPETKAESKEPAKAAEPAKAVELVFKDQKGEPIKGSVIDAFTAMATEKGWTQEVADQELGRLSQSMRDARKAVEAAWTAELKADKEIGGSKLEESLGQIKTAIEKVAGADYLKSLEEAGLSNHPPTLRAWAKVAKAISADGFTAGVKVVTKPGDLPNPNDTSVAAFAGKYATPPTQR